MPKRNDLPTVPPLPGGQVDIERREVAALRLRLQTDAWLQDAIEERARHFSTERDDHQGPTDTSTNFQQSVTSELSKLYDEEPEAANEDEEAAEQLLQDVDDGGLWQINQLNQSNVIAMNEDLIHVSWTPGDGYVFRLVTPNMVYVEASPAAPDVPWILTEARPRTIDNELQWTWDQYDISNPSDPQFRIVLPDDKGSVARDITEDVLAEEGTEFTNPTGAGYPFRFADGTPFLPYSIYHYRRTGHMWSPGGAGIAQGTLTLAVLWTFWLHVTRDTGFPQRYIVGGHVKGGTVDTGNAHSSIYSHSKSVEVDPALVLQISQDGNDAVQVGQWNPGGDPKMYGEAISAWELRLGVHYDLGGEDFQRSGSAESGYALTVKRTKVREAQNKQAPQFRRGDTYTLSIAAAIQNRSAGTSYPEDGYTVAYKALKKSPSEVQVESEAMDARIARGTATKVDAYMAEHPGVNRNEALVKLLELQNETKLLNAGITPLAPGEGMNDV